MKRQLSRWRIAHGLTRLRDPLSRASSASRIRGARCTPLGAIFLGLLAGAAGTAAMDLLWFCRYRRSGGRSAFPAWEFSSGLSSWEDAPAPAQVGKRIVEGLFEVELPPRRAALMNNLTHWMYGMVAGVQYAIVVESLPARKIWYGLPLGASIWTASYVVLPEAKLYKPIWKYDPNTLVKDLSAHLVYGLCTATVLQLTG